MSPVSPVTGADGSDGAIAARRPGPLPTVERDALYRENTAWRTSNARIDPARLDDDLSVAVLGLEQATISRLVRAGWTRVSEVRSRPPEVLWRSVGRHGIADLLRRLAHHGLALPDLTDYERWRLGLVERRALAPDLDVEAPIADLWPVFGKALAEALVERGFRRIGDLAPIDDERLLLLYRLGKVNLRKVQAILEAACARATDATTRQALEAGLRRVAARSEPGRNRARDLVTDATPRPPHRA
jgi:hypothetical protein